MAVLDFPASPTVGQIYPQPSITGLPQYRWDGEKWLMIVGSTSASQPQGRLTLASNTPVMTTSQANKTILYYTPYHGNALPIYDGANMLMRSFTEISVLTTDTVKNPAAIAASKVNDWFVWDDAGTPRLCHGPDWTSDTSRSAGTALVMVNGILLNAVAITNGPAIQRGTYVGTTRSNASSQLDWIYGGLAVGGVAAFHNVWNAYSRVRVMGRVATSDDGWTYTVANVWRPVNTYTTMRVSFVSGLLIDVASANYFGIASNGASNVYAAVGIGENNTTLFSGLTGFLNAGSSNVGAQVNAIHFNQLLGFNFFQAIETCGGSIASFSGDAGVPGTIQAGLSYELWA